MSEPLIRLPLPSAIASILGKRDHDDYRDIGQMMTAKDLYKLIGLTGSPMLYNYMSGKTKTIEPERAVVILDKFNVLIDDWLTPEELRGDVTNKELSLKIAREPIKDLLDTIADLSYEAETLGKLQSGLRGILVRYKY